MNYRDFLYSKLSEESGELAQAAIKCQLFGEAGVDPTRPDAGTNAEELRKELTDITAVLSLLNEHLNHSLAVNTYGIDEARLGRKKLALKRMHSEISHKRLKGN